MHQRWSRGRNVRGQGQELKKVRGEGQGPTFRGQTSRGQGEGWSRPKTEGTIFLNCGRKIFQITDNRSLFVATRVEKQTKNKVKDLTSKLGARMETGRLRRDLLGLQVEKPSGLLFNGLL